MNYISLACAQIIIKVFQFLIAMAVDLFKSICEVDQVLFRYHLDNGLRISYLFLNLSKINAVNI